MAAYRELKMNRKRKKDKKKIDLEWKDFVKKERKKKKSFAP
jgi:hypothetical protein